MVRGLGISSIAVGAAGAPSLAGSEQPDVMFFFLRFVCAGHCSFTWFIVRAQKKPSLQLSKGGITARRVKVRSDL